MAHGGRGHAEEMVWPRGAPLVWPRVGHCRCRQRRMGPDHATQHYFCTTHVNRLSTV